MHCCIAQTATFITLNIVGQLHRVTVGSSGCNATPLNLCNNFAGNPLSIALDNNILYIVDNQGYLYKSNLTSSGTNNTCTNIGKFITTPTSSLNFYGLTVGNGGIVYAAIGSRIESYNPNTNVFKVLGSIPTNWSIGGDLLFYQGALYEAVKVNGGDNALIKINLTNPSASTLYMNFNAGSNVYGFASVTIPCSGNQTYALSTVGNNTEVFTVDMITKTQATTATCSLNFKVNDAASIAETQSATAPSTPTANSPFNICQNDAFNFIPPTVGSIKDTLRWYTQANGGASFGSPTPAISSIVLGTTNYYVSAYDTSTGCESVRDTIIVNINAYPAVPTINPTGSISICSGGSIILNSSSPTGNQWYLNGSAISGSINQIYSTNTIGNYTVTTTSTGCSKTSLPTIINIANASIAYSGSPFCPVGIKLVSLTGNVGGKFKATPNGLSIDSVTGTLNLLNSAIGRYRVTYTVGNTNCEFYDSVIIAGENKKINYTPNKYCGTSSLTTIHFPDNTIVTGIVSATPPGLVINATNGSININASAIGKYNIIYTYGTAGLGCGVIIDSTTFEILGSTTSTDSITICPNKVPYIWNGITFNTAGTQTKTGLINSNGCDSSATLNLKISVTIKTTINKNICANNLPYTWNGLVFNSAGSQTFYTTTSAVCDSLVTLVLSVNIATNSITNLNICTKQLPYSWNGLIFTKADTLTAHLYNSNGCDSAALLNLIVDTTTTNIQNFYHCKQIIYKGIIYSNSTTVRDTLFTTKACDSIYNIAHITITTITPTITTINLSHCKQIIYKGIKYTASITLTDTTKSVQGCDSIYNETNIVITPISPVTQTQYLSNCKQIIYKGTTYLNSIILKDTIQSVQGCDSIYNIINITIAPITPTVQIQNLTNCKQIIYKGITYSNSTTAIDTVKSIGGCDSIYSVAIISIVPITTTTKTFNLKHCSHIIYNNISYNNSIILKDTIKNSFGCDSIFKIINIVISPVITTTRYTSLKDCDSVIYSGKTFYTSQILRDTIFSFQGCDSIYKEVSIIIFAKPTISFSNNNIYVLVNHSLQLKPIATNSNFYQWIPTIYLDNPNIQSPICTPQKDTTYKLKVTNNNGCSDSNYVRVIVANSIDIPNVFSPNGDNMNDTWDIKFINIYPQNKVQIFSRYGQLMFSSFQGNYKAWDGKLNGKYVPIGVYYYLIKLSPSLGLISGSLTILR